jgi:phytoene dehydrogenase-like protein
MNDPATLLTRYDAVIIGSGHNGLVAAAYLAGAGLSVLVLEQNDYLGGATTSHQVFPDYDAQLSRYAYLVSLFPSRILQELDLNFETRRRRTASFTPYQDAAGVSRGLVLSNVDANRSRDSMRELTGSDEAWGRYQQLLGLEKAMAEIAWPSLLEPLQSRQDFLNRLKDPEQLEAWSSFVERPLGEVIERYARHDVLRGLLMTDGKIGVFTHPHDPSLLQNRCFLYHVIGNATGEWRVPVGGMRSLVSALVSRCRASGVHFRVSAPADRIQDLGDHHTVDFHDHSGSHQVDATRVLVNAGPRTFGKLLNERWSPSETDEGSVIKINMLLQRLPKVKATGVTSEEAFAGSFHIDEGYSQMQTSWESARRGNLPRPAPGEMYCHTLTDDSILSPALRAQGFHTLTLFGLDMPYRLFTEDHDVRREQVKDIYLQGLNRICAEPFEDCLARDREGRLCLEIKTPQDLERDVDLDLGNIFHNSLSWFFSDDSAQVGQWGVETNYPRIYRAGSSAMRGGAVSGIPGRNAAMCIFRELGIEFS